MVWPYVTKGTTSCATRSTKSKKDMGYPSANSTNI